MKHRLPKVVYVTWCRACGHFGVAESAARMRTINASCSECCTPGYCVWLRATVEQPRKRARRSGPVAHRQAVDAAS